jgi:hypothetical protein
MPKTVLGRASYSAHRLAGVTTLIAVGQTANWNDKVDFVQKPEAIFPPMYSFVFVIADIGLHAVRPFKYEEIIPFPREAKSVIVVDADGTHAVPISELIVPPIDISDDGSASYCVFSWIGINQYLVAKCDVVVPAVYQRAFGPGTFEACQNYIKEHGGI